MPIASIGASSSSAPHSTLGVPKSKTAWETSLATAAYLLFRVPLLEDANDVAMAVVQANATAVGLRHDGRFFPPLCRRTAVKPAIPAANRSPPVVLADRSDLARHTPYPMARSVNGCCRSPIF